MEIIRIILLNKYIRLLAVPIFLIVLWGILTISYVYTIDQSFSVLSYNHSLVNLSNTNNFNKLLKGEKITGSFRAKDNNLGILSVRFRTYIRVPYQGEDILLFRLKDINSNKWVYSNKYRSGLVYDVPFFPFGFPKIANSKGKEYYFEIISLNGNQSNAISLGERDPVLVSKYQYNKSLLLHNRTRLAKFLFIKYFNTLQDPETLFVSFIFSLPFLYYLFLLSPKGISLTRESDIFSNFGFYFRLGLIALILIILFYDVFYFQLPHTLIYLALTLFWVYISLTLTIRSKVSFFIGFLLLILAPLLYYSHNEYLAEQIGAWTWLFLTVGTTLLLTEAKKKIRK